MVKTIMYKVQLFLEMLLYFINTMTIAKK